MQWGSDDPEAVCGMSTATMINRDAFVKAIVLQFQTIFFSHFMHTMVLPLKYLLYKK